MLYSSLKEIWLWASNWMLWIIVVTVDRCFIGRPLHLSWLCNPWEQPWWHPPPAWSSAAWRAEETAPEEETLNWHFFAFLNLASLCFAIFKNRSLSKLNKWSYLGDVAVLDGGGLVQGLPLDPLCGQAAAGDGWPAPECLELGVHNLAVIINLQIICISPKN